MSSDVAGSQKEGAPLGYAEACPLAWRLRHYQISCNWTFECLLLSDMGSLID